MVISIATKFTGRKSKKPEAARGKTTRKEKVKRTIQKIKANLPKKVGSGTDMSPGAMGGRTTPRRGLKRVPESRLKPRRGLTDLMKKTALKGAGASGAAMAGQAMKLAKKLKPKGRLNVGDLKRAKEIMSKRKGK